jgi:hypothetical protein
MADSDNNGNLPQVVGHDTRGRFTSGNTGRPVGALRKMTKAAWNRLAKPGDKAVKEILAALYDRNDPCRATAMKIVAERIMRAPKHPPLAIDVPQLQAPADAYRAMAFVIEATLAGRLLVNEGLGPVKAIDTWRLGIEGPDLELRLIAWEREQREQQRHGTQTGKALPSSNGRAADPQSERRPVQLPARALGRASHRRLDAGRPRCAEGHHHPHGGAAGEGRRIPAEDGPPSRLADAGWRDIAARA